MILTKQRDPENRFDNADVQISADVVSLDDALEAFESFLRGCGFSFEGQLTILEGEEELAATPKDYPPTTYHTHYGADTLWYGNVPSEYGSRDGMGLSDELDCGESIVKPIDRPDGK